MNYRMKIGNVGFRGSLQLKDPKSLLKSEFLGRVKDCKLCSRNQGFKASKTSTEPLYTTSQAPDPNNKRIRFVFTGV